MPDTPDRAAPETVLAFDYGLRRIGVAVGQQVTQSAGAVTTLANGKRGPDWRRIEALLDEWRPDRLIVGVPLTRDGSASSLAPAVKKFCAQLARYGMPVETVDERFSSLEAGEQLRTARRRGSRRRIDKAAVDAAAAALIAERWLAVKALGNGGFSE